jgi:aromatic ring-opening dioxygenase catalytic subunit (LigB family)
MTLVFSGICSHGPGITARPERADTAQRERFFGQLERLRKAVDAVEPDALLIVGAEHFANFFNDNMPSFCLGLADRYVGPIEEPDWLGVPRQEYRGNTDLSRRLFRIISQRVDLSFSEEMKFDHGVMVPIHFLTPNADRVLVPLIINCQEAPLPPLHRAYELGRAIREACDAVPERIAVIGTGGISHWPCTPNSGKIAEEWDRDFLDRWIRNDKDALCAYSDAETLRDAGHGGFEIRTLITVAGTCEGRRGEIWCYEPIPIFAVGCTVGVMDVGSQAVHHAGQNNLHVVGAN